MRFIKLLFVFFLLGLAGWAIFFGRQTFIGTQNVGASFRFEVKEADDWKSVAEGLDQTGIIDSAIGYEMYAFFVERAKHPKPGVYDISPGLSYRAIANQLALGPTRNEVQVRLIEGWTIDQMSELLAREQDVNPTDIVQFIGQSKDIKPMDVDLKAQYIFLKSLPEKRSLEGYLFPNTYRVWKDQLPEGLIRKQLTEFEKRYGDVDPAQLPKPLKTLDEAVILASIVEREVQTVADRKIVASIFLNRLSIGMPLQSDATLSYLTGSKRSQANASDLALNSPYNSYKQKGLPPSPISNPGASALDAVLAPQDTDYLYFLTDAQGTVYYARTLQEHAANRVKAGLN